MSTKTVAEKLLITPNTALWLSDLSHLDAIGPVPGNVNRVDRPGQATTAIIFADDATSLRATLDSHREQWTSPATLWVAYPKGNRADINRDTVWPIVGEHGMRPIGQISIDATWSALRFRANRDGETPFTGGRR